MWFSSKSTNERHRCYLSSGHEFASKEWDVTLSPAPQCAKSQNASSGGTGIACRAGITATDIRNLDASVEWPQQHRVKRQFVNAVLSAGLVVVSVYLTTAIDNSEQNIAFLNTFFSGLACGRLAHHSGWRLQPGWRGARTVWLSSRTTCAHRCAKQRNAAVLGLDGQKGRQLVRGVGGTAHHFVKEVAVDDTQSCAACRSGLQFVAQADSRAPQCLRAQDLAHS